MKTGFPKHLIAQNLILPFFTVFFIMNVKFKNSFSDDFFLLCEAGADIGNFLQKFLLWFYLDKHGFFNLYFEVLTRISFNNDFYYFYAWSSARRKLWWLPVSMVCFYVWRYFLKHSQLLWNLFCKFLPLYSIYVESLRGDAHFLISFFFIHFKPIFNKIMKRN